ncbi:MAG: hypothetical protein AMXMBFR64_49580 [Myxococcales bacterium]
MVNHVRFEGLVGRVSPFGYTARGVPMIAFLLCIHEGPCRPEMQPSHLRVLLASELAESWREALRSGIRVLVEGQLRPKVGGPAEILGQSLKPALRLVAAEGSREKLPRRGASLG